MKEKKNFQSQKGRKGRYFGTKPRHSQSMTEKRRLSNPKVGQASKNIWITSHIHDEVVYEAELDNPTHNHEKVA